MSDVPHVFKPTWKQNLCIAHLQGDKAERKQLSKSELVENGGVIVHKYGAEADGFMWITF
jgi:hypothetical protein